MTGTIKETERQLCVKYSLERPGALKYYYDFKLKATFVLKTFHNRLLRLIRFCCLRDDGSNCLSRFSAIISAHQRIPSHHHHHPPSATKVSSTRTHIYYCPATGMRQSYGEKFCLQKRSIYNAPTNIMHSRRQRWDLQYILHTCE